jgi:hypothetical protein
MNRRNIFVLFSIWMISSLACSTITNAVDSLSSAGTGTPTGAHPNTVTPTPAPTLTPTPQTTGPCNNVLFPLVKGNRWYYQKESGGTTSAINLLVDSTAGDQAKLNLYGAASDLTSSTQVKCREGAILNFPASELGMLFYDPAQGSLTLDYASGEFFPAEKTFTDANWDYQWTTALLATGNFHVLDPNSGEEFSAELNKTPVALAWRTAGAGDAARESITVPAGTFPHALKVFLEATLEVKLLVNVNGLNLTVPAKVFLNGTLWFEPHVGMLKERTDSLDVEYLGLKAPQAVASSVELIKYMQQK